MLAHMLTLTILSSDPKPKPAPTEPPAHLHSAYTMGDRYGWANFYVDEASHDSHYAYGTQDIDTFLQTARATLKHPPDGFPTMTMLASAISSSVSAEANRSKVVVYGSVDPFVECLALAAGASIVHTVEYQKRTYGHHKLKTFSVAEHKSLVDPDAERSGERFAGHFDVAIAHAAFDHDGLGRYGDPLDPWGDLVAMRTAWRALRPGGTLLLTLPLGPDLTVWNVHRRYGQLRLPRMLRGWEELERRNWDDGDLSSDRDHRKRHEVLFVLRRNSTEDLRVEEAEGEPGALRDEL